MIPILTLAGAIHVTLAVLGIGVGFIQFLRPKRGAGHRARGYFTKLAEQSGVPS